MPLGELGGPTARPQTFKLLFMYVLFVCFENGGRPPGRGANANFGNTKCVSVGQSFGRTAGRTVAQSACRSVGRQASVGRGIGRSGGKSGGRSGGRSFGMTGRSVGRSVGPSLGRSVCRSVLELLGARQPKCAARQCVNRSLAWLRGALAPITHIIAQKLLDAQATVAAADAATDVDDMQDSDDMSDRLSPLVGALNTAANRRCV